MPDGPRYEDDFYAWTQHQAEVLRTMPVSDNRFDREHVAEEIEDLGKSERDAVRSQIRRIIEHLLKLAYSPAERAALRLDGQRSSTRDRSCPTSSHRPCGARSRARSRNFTARPAGEHALGTSPIRRS